MSGIIESIKGMMPTSSFFKANYIEILFVIIFVVTVIVYFTVSQSSTSSVPNGYSTTAAAQSEKILAFSNPNRGSKRAIISHLGPMNMKAPPSLINF